MQPRSRRFISSSPNRPVVLPAYFPVMGSVDVTNPSLVGDDEGGEIVSVTTDTTPELQFRWPGAAPVNVTLHDGTTTHGPYTVVGSVANVTSPLPLGVYTIDSGTTAENSQGEQTFIRGSLHIIANTDSFSLLIGNTVSLLVQDSKTLLAKNG